MAEKGANGKVIASAGTVVSAVVGIFWWYINNTDTSRVVSMTKQDECAVVLKDRADQQAKTRLAVDKLNKRVQGLESLLIEMSNHLVGHALHPKKKLAEPLELMRAVKRVRDGD